ncbi:MAG: ATP-binding cassette domain-containing protein [Bacteroidetes bacterium]|nr:ATP-binding cassette domain-containing protein [Bacteroidota bacterium]
MSSDASFLSLNSVTFGQESRLLIQHFSLAIARSGFTVLFGGTGSGKTLVMKLLAGIYHPHEGEVLVDGMVVGNLTPAESTRLKRRMGFVFQDAALISNLSIRENLMLPLNQHLPDLTIEEKTDQIKNMLTRFGIIQSIDRRPADLSLTQRRLAGWARALMTGPDILLADDPLTGIDPVNRKRLMMELASLKASGTTVVCATQSLIGLDELADKIAVLDHGTLIDFGSLDDIHDSTHAITTRLLADDRQTHMINRT